MLNLLKRIFGISPECPLKIGDKIKLVINTNIYSFKLNEIYTASSFYLSQNQDCWFVRVKEVPGSTLCSDFEIIK